MSDAAGRLAAALADRYRLERELGQGGMATVYLAEDLKHQRQVAIKVLRPELAAVLGAERFVQEITTTAQLQHPHILPLFDSGQADSFLYYVMPYIEGETLRARLDREKQLGVDEAVRITREVADALDYAHRHGVIHRDIKPENILLHDGRPMVADFGIALAVSAAAGGRMTETGLSLGTPHYMSPEQATAEKEITARSDVYSLASVLYEMLAGQPPHLGGSAQQIIMKIIAEPVPEVTTLRKSVPANVAAALAQALEKLPADRFESAKAFGEALANPAFTGTATHMLAGAAVATRRTRTLTWALGATTVVLAVALAVTLLRPSTPPPAVSLHAELGDSVYPSGVTVSSDGATFAVSALTGRRELYLRNADNDDFRLLPGTEGAIAPAFSPDGRSILFMATAGVQQLRRVDLTSGNVETIADSAVSLGWCGDGDLVIMRGQSIERLPGGRGRPEVLATLDSSVALRGGTVLPGCQGMLTDDRSGALGFTVRLTLIDFRSKAMTVLAEQGSGARYVPSGHILYITSRPDPTLVALPFDVAHLRATGDPVPLIPHVGNFDMSRAGTLIYTETPPVSGEQLVWADARGRTTPLPVQIQDLEAPRLAPDGRHLAVSDFNDRSTLVYDIVTGTTTRLLAGLTRSGRVWSADSRSLYASTIHAVVRVHADGTGVVDTLWPHNDQVFAVTPDQQQLVLVRNGTSSGADIEILQLGGSDPTIVPYLHANWNERQPALSPDGRWLAYTSDETGQYEVYVRSFPVPGDAVKISENGGVGPAWSADGSAIYYAGARQLVRADLSRGAAGPTVRSRTPLFAHDRLEVTYQRFFQDANEPRRWDVAGRDRFLMVSSTEETFNQPVRLMVVTNFLDELRRKTGAP